jgi:hypothetical protein
VFVGVSVGVSVGVFVGVSVGVSVTSGVEVKMPSGIFCAAARVAGGAPRSAQATRNAARNPQTEDPVLFDMFATAAES